MGSSACDASGTLSSTVLAESVSFRVCGDRGGVGVEMGTEVGVAMGVEMGRVG